MGVHQPVAHRDPMIEPLVASADAGRLLVIAGDQSWIQRRDPRLDRRPRPAAISIFRDTGLQAAFVLVGASIADVLVAIGFRKEETEADAACRIGGRGIEALRASNGRAEINPVLEGWVG